MKRNLKFETRNLKWGILFTLLASHVFALDVKMTIQPPMISMGESAQVRIEVRDAKHPQPPVLPTVPGLTFSGAGQSTQHSWVNGKSDRFTAYTFTAYPQRTGEFTIGPFAYNVGKETQTLQGTLKVVATAGDTTQAQSWSDLIFAKLDASKKSVYVQEPFELTLSIYSRPGLQMANDIGLQGMPETGLSDLEWEELPGRREQIGGNLYDIRLYRTTVRTMGAGQFEFKPTVTVQVVLPNQQRQRRDPFFGSFFNQRQTRPVELPVQKTTVSVQPLPTLGKPAGFTGAVGNFQFGVTAQPLSVHPGDPVTLTMTVIGNGNFDRVLPPALPDEGSFRLFGDPVRQTGNNGVQFEQVISPVSATVSNIPPITFSYFDTQSGQYRTVKSREIPITVTASSNDTAQLFAAKETVTQPDLPFVAESDVQRAVGFITLAWQSIRPWLWTLPTILGIGLVLFFARKIHHSRRKNVAKSRRQKAPKAARAALKKASLARKNGDAAAFYNALWNALADYFGNRLNLAPGEISAPIIFQTLENSTLSSETLDRLKELFHEVDAGRYSPVPPSTEKTEQQLLFLTQTLKQCEKCKFQ